VTLKVSVDDDEIIHGREIYVLVVLICLTRQSKPNGGHHGRSRDDEPEVKFCIEDEEEEEEDEGQTATELDRLAGRPTTPPGWDTAVNVSRGGQANTQL